MFKCRSLLFILFKEKIAPPIFHGLFTSKPENKYNIRSRGKLTEIFYRKKRIQFNIDYRGTHLWNELFHDNFSKLEIIHYFIEIVIISQENQGIYIDVHDAEQYF